MTGEAWILSAVTFVAWVFLARSVEVEHVREALCRACRYSLAGLAVPCTCPECGKRCEGSIITKTRYRWRFNRWGFASLTVVACAVAVVLPYVLWNSLWQTSDYAGRVSWTYMLGCGALSPMAYGLPDRFSAGYVVILVVLALLCPYQERADARGMAVLSVCGPTVAVLLWVWLNWSAGAMALDPVLEPVKGLFVLLAIAMAFFLCVRWLASKS